jgi:hypothetical protein
MGVRLWRLEGLVAIDSLGLVSKSDTKGYNISVSTVIVEILDPCRDRICRHPRPTASMALVVDQGASRRARYILEGLHW